MTFGATGQIQTKSEMLRIRCGEYLSASILNPILQQSALDSSTKFLGSFDALLFKNCFIEKRESSLVKRKKQKLQSYRDKYTAHVVALLNAPIHWLIAHVDKEAAQVRVYDSLGSCTWGSINLPGFFSWLVGKKLSMKAMDIAPQTNGYDCGTYALYYGVSVLRRRSPARDLNSDTSPEEIRRMIADFWTAWTGFSCLIEGCRVDEGAESPSTQCDYCYKWFHNQCVLISKEEIEGTFHCPECVKRIPSEPAVRVAEEDVCGDKTSVRTRRQTR